MKIFIAVFLLCTVPIIAAQYYDYSMEEAIDNAGKAMATMWDNSYTCSISCMKPPMEVDAPWAQHMGGPSNEISAIIPAYLNATCDQYAKMKQCLSQCPHGSIKTIITTLSTPTETMCSDKFKSMIKNNIQCVSNPSISNISQQCLQMCPPVPDCREISSYPKYLRRLNIPTLVKKCGAEYCEFANCVTQCFAKSLVTRLQCDPKAVDMMKDLFAKTYLSARSLLLQNGMTMNEIPPACQSLAKP